MRRIVVLFLTVIGVLSYGSSVSSGTPTVPISPGAPPPPVVPGPTAPGKPPVRDATACATPPRSTHDFAILLERESPISISVPEMRSPTWTWSGALSGTHTILMVPPSGEGSGRLVYTTHYLCGGNGWQRTGDSIVGTATLTKMYDREIGGLRSGQFRFVADVHRDFLTFPGIAAGLFSVVKSYTITGPLRTLSTIYQTAQMTMGGPVDGFIKIRTSGNYEYVKPKDTNVLVAIGSFHETRKNYQLYPGNPDWVVVSSGESQMTRTEEFLRRNRVLLSRESVDYRSNFQGVRDDTYLKTFVRFDLGYPVEENVEIRTTVRSVAAVNYKKALEFHPRSNSMSALQMEGQGGAFGGAKQILAIDYKTNGQYLGVTLGDSPLRLPLTSGESSAVQAILRAGTSTETAAGFRGQF